MVERPGRPGARNQYRTDAQPDGGAQHIAAISVSYLSEDSTHHRSIAQLMDKLEYVKRDVRDHRMRAAYFG